MNEIQSIKAYVPDLSVYEILPFLILTLGAVFCLVVDAATNKEGSRKFLPIICGGTLLVTMASCFFDLFPSIPFIEETFRATEFAQLGSLVILFASFCMTLFAPRVIEQRNLPSGEFYTLILFATLGMVLLSVANELITAFISLEILSLALYVLIGIDRKSARAAEASYKYFILGSFASAFLVMGIAFLFGATGTTYLNEMSEVFKSGGITITEWVESPSGERLIKEVAQPINAIWVYIGFALLFVGACFKLSLAPFHMWAPDVYDGGNTPTVMVIATASKVAAIAFLAHISESLSYWAPFAESAGFLFGLVAVASMLWGNLAGLVQTRIKRMLAYSSIAHTGYTTIGILVLASLPGILSGDDLIDAQSAVRNAIIFYMAGYTIMNIVAFGIAAHIGGEGEMSSYRGLAQRKPLAALGMAIVMFSLLGIPPTVGFMGKFYLFKEAVQYGFVGLAVVGVLSSVISAFYYLNLVVTMFMREEDTVTGSTLAGVTTGGTALFGSASVSRIILFAAVLMVFLFGILPSLFFALDFNLGLF